MMTLFFGAAIGVIVAIAIAYFAGFISWDRTGGPRNIPISETPGVDMLNEYQCRKGETKHIILGGIEDNFSLGNEEIVEHNEIQEERYRRADYKHAITHRNYDEGGLDKALVDTFLIPSRTVNGVFATRIKQLSNLKNDGINIGNLFDIQVRSDNLSMNFQPENLLPGWHLDNGLLSTELNTVKYENQTLPRTFDGLVEQIRAGDGYAEIGVQIADDTMVDFIGFAVCTEPEENNGMTFHAGVYEMPEKVVSFSCRDKDQVICDGYSGDTACSTALPVICFKDTLHSKPDVTEATIPAASKHILNHFWSGGEVKLSSAVRGDNFKTSDDVNAFCRSQFGKNWRVASHHESYSDYVIGYGSAPIGTKAWIDVKSEPHGNCWKHRKDYESTHDR